MPEFVLVIRKPDGSTEEYGTHQFTISPMTGDYIEINDKKGIGQAYEVFARVHPLDPVKPAYIILDYVSSAAELREGHAVGR